MIKRYAEAGFRVFPLDGKIPLIKEWQNVPYDPDPKIQGNFGVVTGSEILVIDIDVKNGAPGRESYDKLVADAKLPPGWEEETFVVMTGTGGFHIYTRIPKDLKDIKIKKHNKEYPGIDFLTENTFVVGAGCIHPDTGRLYEVLFRSPNEVCPTPTALLDLLSSAPTKIVDLAQNANAEDFVDDEPVNIERFIETLAQMPVATEGFRSTAAYSCACRGREYGLSIDICTQTMLAHYNGQRCTPALPQDELTQIVVNAYSYAKNKQGSKNVKNIFTTAVVGEVINLGEVRFDKDKHGLPRPTLNNAVNHIATTSLIAETFRFNCFSQQIEITSKAPWYAERGHKGPVVDKHDIPMLRYYLAKSFHVEYNEKQTKDGMVVVAKKRHYHPVQNYLNSLVWDGTSRVEDWLIRLAKVEDNAYTRAVSRKMLCAAVKRVFEPGCKFDNVVIIEGAQGARKSTLCSVLGKLWYSTMTIDPHHKDSVHNMAGKWIIETPEMTALGWADQNALKDFLSRSTDTVRLSYAETSQDYPRQSIFIGTVNPGANGYLKDRTGNRRYWIVSSPCTRTNPIDIMGLENECDQLWAEAFQLYKTEPLYLTGEAEEIQINVTAARMPEEPYIKAIKSWSRNNPKTDEIQTSDLLEHLGFSTKGQTRIDTTRMAEALEMLGWERVVRQERGVHEVIYCRPLEERIIRDAL